MMEFTTPEVVLLLGLGALLALDQDAGLGMHLSQPLVAGSLTGLVVGRFEMGAAAGGVLQLLWMTVQPVGGARFPDLALAGMAAVLALPAEAPARPWLEQPFLAAPVVVGILAGWAGGAAIGAQRRLHGMLSRRHAAALEAGSERAVGAVQRRALVLHGLRGALGVLLLLWAAPLLGSLLLQWGLQLGVARYAAGIGIVAMWRVSGGGWKPAAALGFVLGFLPGVW